MTDELLTHIEEETNRFVNQKCICIDTIAVYRPGKNISIDESLWKFRGCLSFRTYNLSKCAKFGVKVNELSASDGLGARYTSM